MLAARIAWCLLLACAVIHAAADLPTQARPPLFSYAWRMGSLGSAADAAQAGVYTTAAAEHLCTGLPLCRGFAYIGNNRSTAAQLTVFKTATTQGNRSDGRWSTWIKTGLETLPALVVPVGMSGLNLSLRVETFTVQALTVASDPWGKNFSFTRALDARSALPFGMHLGDITLRLRRRADDDGDDDDQEEDSACSAASSSKWSTFSTAGGIGGVAATPVAPPPGSTSVLAAHDVSALLEHSSGGSPFPLSVVRSYEVSDDGKALVLKLNVSLPSDATGAVEIGGLGFAMPEGAGRGLERMAWAEAHVGLEHGFVEFVRVVDDEATLLVTAERGFESATKLEAWRPLLESVGDSGWDNEWVVYSAAWAA